VTARDLLELALSPELLAALDEHISEVAAEAVRDELARQAERRWLPVEEAASRYGCSAAALRMRISRGTVEHRQGRRLYVRADPDNTPDTLTPIQKAPRQRSSAPGPDTGG
jgi:hypothetical protein